MSHSYVKKTLHIVLVCLIASLSPTPAQARENDTSSNPFGLSSSMFDEINNYLPDSVNINPQPSQPEIKTSAPPTTTISINQGDAIFSHDGIQLPGEYVPSAKCTVGYVNKEKRYLITAGHCAEDGTTIYNSRNEAIGIFHRFKPDLYNYDIPRPKAIQESMASDTAHIQLFDTVTPGDNIYSGDKRISSSAQVPVGTEICTYGRTTARVQCSRRIDYEFMPLPNHVMIVDVDSQHGDSGGPVWIKNGGGYIGNISATWPGHTGFVAIH